MQEAIQTFQNELKHKLQYKASSKISPDTFLYKSFKFFDLYNNGYLEKGDFFKAIAKCGVVVDTHDMQKIYNYYDIHKDGNIHYKQFIQNLLFSQSEQNSLKMSQSQMSQTRKHQQSIAGSRNKNLQQPVQKSKANKEDNYLKQSNINRIYRECQTYAEVRDFIKKTLKQHGISGLLIFAVELKLMDSQRSHRIHKSQLQDKLPFLSQNSIDLVMKQFESQSHGEINYAELVYSLKGQLDYQQEVVIQKAFDLLDDKNQKQIQIQKVINNFNYSGYNQQLKRAINLYSTFQGIDDGIFTDEDFMDFFGFMSFSFNDRYQFITFVEKGYLNYDTHSQHSQRSTRSRQFKRQSGQLNNSKSHINTNINPDFRKNKQQATHINQTPHSPDVYMKDIQFSDDKKDISRKSERSQRYSQIDRKSSTTSYYIKEVQMIVLRIKKRLASRGSKGFLILEKSLKHVDADRDGLINLDQLKKVIRDLKIDITNNECNLFFDVFDPDTTNLISYDQMIHSLKGQMPAKRKQYFQRVWNSVKVNQEFTTFSAIKHCLNFRGHPDIQTGRRYDDQIFKEIQQTIFLIQELNEIPRNENITKKQFQEYYENLSLSINQDQLFETLLQNFWKMQPKTNINQMYAGSRKLFDPKAKGYLMDHHRYAVKGGSISSNAPFGTSSEPTSYLTEHGKL